MDFGTLLNTLTVTSQVVNGQTFGVGAQETLIADSGNDTLTGGKGNDTFIGGSGNDTMNGGSGNNTFIAGSGSDQMQGSSGNDSFVAGAGNDLMYGGGGNDTFVGGAGNDTMDAQGGSALYIGGSGFDVMGNSNFFSGSTQGHTIDANGNAVGSTYVVGTGGAVIYSSNYSNTYELAVGDGSDTIVGVGDGIVPWDWWDTPNSNVNNVLQFGAGVTASSLTAEVKGADLILHYSPTDSVVLDRWFTERQHQVQTLRFADGSTVDFGTLLNTLTVTIAATNGQALGFGLRETLIADSGNDTLVGGNGSDTFIGGAGNDVMLGGIGNDSFVAGAGNDVMYGGGGNDTFIGGAGNDTMDAQGGSALYIGGKGFNVMGNADFYSTTTQGHTIDANGNAVGSTYVVGTGGAVIYSSNYSNIYELSLGDGSDTIIGVGANFQSTNTSGAQLNRSINNIVQFGQGVTLSDVSVEARGADLIVHYSSTDSLLLDGWFTEQVHQVQTLQFFDGSEIDFATFLDGLSISSTVKSDLVYGIGAHEYLVADDANDTLIGGAGDDTFVGGAGRDSMVGGSGNNVFIAGTGTDTMNGGAGSNLFVAGSGNDLMAGGGGVNTYQIGIGGGVDTIVTGNNHQDYLQLQGVVESVSYGTQGDDLVLILGKGSVEQSEILIKNQLADASLIGISMNGSSYSISNQAPDVLQIRSTAGSDTIISGDGNDSVYFGTGGTSIYGGGGNDTFFYGVGDGAAHLYAQEKSSNQFDSLVISGAKSDQLWFKQVGNDLEMDVIGTADSVVMNGWYASSSNHIQSFVASDGKVLTDTAVDQLVQAMASMAPPGVGQVTLTSDQQQTLSTVLSASWK